LPLRHREHGVLKSELGDFKNLRVLTYAMLNAWMSLNFPKLDHGFMKREGPQLFKMFVSINLYGRNFISKFTLFLVPSGNSSSSVTNNRLLSFLTVTFQVRFSAKLNLLVSSTERLFPWSVAMTIFGSSWISDLHEDESHLQALNLAVAGSIWVISNRERAY